jgi:hypothetical protein
MKIFGVCASFRLERVKCRKLLTGRALYLKNGSFDVPKPLTQPSKSKLLPEIADLLKICKTVLKIIQPE